MWEIDEISSWLRALARFAHVISMDQRGIGLSDRANVVKGSPINLADLRPIDREGNLATASLPQSGLAYRAASSTRTTC